MTGLV